MIVRSVLAAAGLLLALAAGCLRSFEVPDGSGGAGAATSSSGAKGGGETCDSATIDSYADVVMADHPIAYYRFDAFDGKTAVPEIGPPGTATDVKASPIGAVGSKGSIAFDIFDGYVDFGATAFEELGVEPMTFEVWVNPFKGDWGKDQFPTFLVKQNAAGDGLASAIREDGLNVILWRDKHADMGFQTLFEDVPTNAWTHVVIVFDPAAPRVVGYLDGIAHGGAYACDLGHLPSCPSFANDGPLVLGGAAGQGNPYIGLLDELAVYPVALSEERICVHHRAGVAAQAH